MQVPPLMEFDLYSFGIELPWWALCAVAAAVLALKAVPALRHWLAWRRAQRRLFRRAHRLCDRCGYSLTGNTSGVCPECGTPTGRTLG